MNTWMKMQELNISSSEVHTQGGAQSSSQRALGYFSQLSKAMVEDLYNIYQLDFMLFSYKPDLFIDVAKKDNNNLNLFERTKLSQMSQRKNFNQKLHFQTSQLSYIRPTNLT